MQLLLGFLAAVIICYAAFRVHSLSKDGAYAAAAVGTIVFGLGGWQWSVLLLTFFVSSSALTRAFGRGQGELSEKYSKGGQRDTGQVLGNGGVAVIFVLLHLLNVHAAWPWLGYAGALAAVNADTWATELGVLSPAPPRLITDLRATVDKGTSGAVSLWGTLSALLGAALIGLPAAS
jgi:uncharacterized protein (TIGR00297 family)